MLYAWVIRAALVLVFLALAPAARAQEGRLVLWDERIGASLAELLAVEAGCSDVRGAAEHRLCLLQRRSGVPFAGQGRRSSLDGVVLFLDTNRNLHLGTNLAPNIRLHFSAKPGKVLRGEAEFLIHLRIRR